MAGEETQAEETESLTEWNASRTTAVHMRRMLALVLLLAAASAACRADDSREAQEYWRRLEERSLEVAGNFLNAAASGDSLGLAATATDSIVRLLSEESEGGARELTAAARQFETSRKNVRVYGTGALITFPYTFAGQRTRAGIWTGYAGDRLVVTDFAEHIKVD